MKRAIMMCLLMLCVGCAKDSPQTLTVPPAPSPRAGTCSSVLTYPDQGGQHITPPATSNYNSNPPTSGEHYNQGAPNGPAFTGVHTEQIQNEIQVHNLEHGHIGIQYTSAVPSAVRTALEAFVREDPQWIFIAPKADLPNPLAFTAWTKLQVCDAVDAALAVSTARAFTKQFKDKSPRESVVGTPQP